MRIYTRLGDQGLTSLYTPKGAARRLSKSHARVEAYGSIDELGALLGVLRAELPPDDAEAELLRWIQNRLFHAGYDISTVAADAPVHSVQRADTERLEREIDRLEALLPPLRQFVLAGGNRPAALAHLCRTVARRAERRVVAAQAEAEINPEVLRFLNRLSDLLFVLARQLLRRAGGSEEEVDWRV